MSRYDRTGQTWGWMSSQSLYLHWMCQRIFVVWYAFLHIVAEVIVPQSQIKEKFPSGSISDLKNTISEGRACIKQDILRLSM